MAYWFKSKDSVTRVAVLRLLSLAVLMAGYFFTPCHSMPTNKDVSNNDPWWCQPCKAEHKTRHSRGINNPVKDTFRIIINRYESNVSEYVRQLHTKLQIANMTKKQFRKNNWLPRKKFFKKIRKDDDKILPELHHQVQIYAVTIQRLLNMEIRSEDDSFDVTYRSNILNIVKSDIDLLRCEIQQEIEEKRLEAPAKVPANFVDKKIPSAADHLADGLIKDYSILKEYYNFLKKCSNKMFSKANKNRKNKKVKNDKPKNKSKRTSQKDLNQKSEQS